MLLLALALHSALPATEPQRHRKPRTMRSVPVMRVPTSARPMPVVRVPRDPNERYRLPLPSTEVVDAKVDAVKDKGMPCGTTGAPWCPRDGRQVLKTKLGGD